MTTVPPGLPRLRFVPKPHHVRLVDVAIGDLGSPQLVGPGMQVAMYEALASRTYARGGPTKDSRNTNADFSESDA